ncbi:hypothetical protein PV08_05152 [Exophiala spinifera]|uniref:Enoyl reductase (ER) domain-containing protein n=1 Tax=Exophiala spinifera TaxID=91928 RepID=A0A0D1ZZ72_9EURO|nr:uncharacterized protein PV08_05152 [Exophiala spinifera]KIW17957.1 hypothetical protein PV08_05152 [Exophiala spinifera]
MKSGHVYASTPESIEVKVLDQPIPTPGPNDIVIKVIVSGTNPKDWKLPVYWGGGQGMNTGDDIAGYVHALGKDVTGFRVGDRVAAFHEMTKPFGSFAEYALAWEKTTFHLPSHTTFEEAATIPLAAMTAALALFHRLGLPEPWVGDNSQARRDAQAGGVLVYGAASAVGAFAIKLLKRANIHPIIAVAGRGIPFVESIIDTSKGDTIIDYRKGNKAIVDSLKAAIPAGKRLLYAFDTVSENGSYQNIVQALDPRGNLALILPGLSGEGIPDTVNWGMTPVSAVHGFPLDLGDFGYAWFRLFTLGLKEGWLNGHPHEVIPGGLRGVQKGLENLGDGKASAVKYVYRIEETE